MAVAEAVDRCPVCGSPHASVRLSLNAAFAGEVFEAPLGICGDCGAGRLLKRIPPERIASTYAGGYLFAEGESPGFLAYLASLYRRQSLDYEARRDARATGLRPGAAILDYGAGTGDRVLRLRAAGFTARGFEPFSPPSPAAAPHLFRSWDEVTAAIPGGVLDMIQFNHSLAHIHDLPAALDAALALVKPGGWAVVRTPNPDSFQAGIFGARWQGVDPVRILYQFPPRALDRLFASREFSPGPKDFSFHPLHPPTFTLSLFPGLDPVGIGPGGALRKAGWGLATLACILPAALERACGRTSVYAAYYRKGAGESLP